jgi:hypothetical protein
VVPPAAPPWRTHAVGGVLGVAHGPGDRPAASAAATASPPAPGPA